MDLQRIQMLIGEIGINKLNNAKILVVGVGGVGGWLCEMLVRSGIGHLGIIDFDTIESSNINRQIIALHNNIGLAKVDGIETRLKSINPNIKLLKYNEKLSAVNIVDFKLENYDFVIDCVDDFDAKCAMISYCYEKNIQFLSCMGTGNRVIIPQYKIVDIFKTCYDGLARKIRKYCRESHIKKLAVVSTFDETLRKGGDIGSVVYHPVNCASVVCGYIINKLLEEK